MDGIFLGNDNTMLSCLVKSSNTYTLNAVEGWLGIPDLVMRVPFLDKCNIEVCWGFWFGR